MRGENVGTARVYTMGVVRSGSVVSDPESRSVPDNHHSLSANPVPGVFGTRSAPDASPEGTVDPLVARSRRLAPNPLAGNAVCDLFDGVPSDEVARRWALPAAALRGLRSFYELVEPAETRVCQGTTCRFAPGERLAGERIACLGACYDAPTALVRGVVYGRVDATTRFDAVADLRLEARTAPVRRRSLVDGPVVLRNVVPDRVPVDEYDLPDGDRILAAIASSGLRGRGGAAFPTAAKWRAARETPAPDRYVVANGDEGDPGSFVDRLLLEDDPHSVLAGMVACARVIGARRGVVYVRGEYPRARAVMIDAVHAARAAGVLGDLDVEVISGAGSYVCGEETALLRSIEGLRGEPTPKPPYPAQRGLFDLPTVVQNVETLAIVPWIVRTGTGSGTKAVSVSGAVAEPGVVEVALGTPIRRILDEGGGGPPAGRRWKMALVGGPMGRVVPEAQFDTPLSYDTLPGMGHAGIVVLDDTVRVCDLAHHLFDFAQAESCGSCTPCRVGTAQLGSRRDRMSLERLLDTLEQGSKCGFGLGVPRPIRDLLAHYGPEVFAC